MSKRYGFEDLVSIMDRLRSEDGCPWDREQTYDSLRTYLLEEAAEVAEAIDARDEAGLREELGDLLFQIVFLSRIGKERGRFDVDDVAHGIAEKMVRRHPHVFADATATTAADVVESWEAIKAREKEDRGEAEPGSLLDGVPAVLPALVRAVRLGEKAARVGLDWPDRDGVAAKVEEEWRELRGALAEGTDADAAEELGDLLFAVAMLARKLALDPEQALARANSKFKRRIRQVEAAVRRDGRDLDRLDLDTLEAYWARVKSAERRGEP